MGFRIFFYRISKFIWGMSLADRPVICKTLQFLVANILLSTRIQDSRFKAQKKFFSQTSLDSRLKVQGSEKTSSTQPLWIQDSRWKAEGLRIQAFFGILNLEPYLLGFFKMSFWDLESWILPPWIREVFWGSWILNPPPWVQEVFWDLESWILNPTPLDSRSCLGILNLESWIPCT